MPMSISKVILLLFCLLLATPLLQGAESGRIAASQTVVEMSSEVSALPVERPQKRGLFRKLKSVWEDGQKGLIALILSIVGSILLVLPWFGIGSLIVIVLQTLGLPLLLVAFLLSIVLIIKSHGDRSSYDRKLGIIALLVMALPLILLSLFILSFGA
ncbi:MAG: hypothetical protein NWR72_16590 [Bacteroidia bacterium]|nr:hypothetical protein [Bacteroidia bacterium]